MNSLDAMKNRVVQSLEACRVVSHITTQERSDFGSHRYDVAGELPGGRISGQIVPPERCGFSFITLFSDDGRRLGQFQIMEGRVMGRETNHSEYNTHNPFKSNPDINAALVGFMETFKLRP